jgi:hypothetical protein
MAIEAPSSARHSTALPLVLKRLPRDRPLVLRRPGPPLVLLSRPLVRLPPTTTVVTPKMANAGVAAPPVEVPPAGVAAKADHCSTTPGTETSPCGQVKPPVPHVLRCRLS